ncbi:Protein NRDE2-like protein [Ophiocordyceps camponoti-floridani]|uniref:Protein NRDE2-like protein n=1 Tax=Ophiocordyceps camponoti-floridani TaxID=2030778 RepID=A0A8H4VDM1_9HYPO|nr:Protein NRDE2-like protein [Ophiocordyceps camponoti-floridani]
MADGDDDAKLRVPKFSSFKHKASGSAGDGPAEGELRVPKFSSFKSTEAISTSELRTGGRGLDETEELQRGKRKYDGVDGEGESRLRRDGHRPEKRRHEEYRQEKHRYEKNRYEKHRHEEHRNEKRRQEKHRHEKHRHEKHHHDKHRRDEHHHDNLRSRSHPDSHHRDTSRREKQHQRSGDSEKRRARTSLAESVPGLFVIDKKGDPLIRKYGLDRYRIPSYSRYGGNRVLGTDGRLVIHRDGPVQKFSLLFPGQRLSDLLGERSSSSRDVGGLRSRDWIQRKAVRLRPRRDRIVDNDEEEGYLRLESPRKRRRHHRHSGSSDGEDATPWRWIETKAKADDEEEEEEEEEEEASSESDVEEGDDPLRWKSSQLHRRVKDHPDDIAGWLELVAHQDIILSGDNKGDNDVSENAARSISEVKVHLLESALSHASRPSDRETVLAALMREGVKIWSRKVADKKWAQVSDDEHGSFELWKAHVDYAMSSITTVQYEAVKTMMMERLHQACSRALPSYSYEAIYVFLRATRFIHDAGYKELAVAAWQGLLELNLFRPEGIDNQTEALAIFRDFWESEVPRLGEEGAQGWRQYVQNGGVGDAPDPVNNVEPVDAPQQDPYDAWGAAEGLCGKRASMPARTMDGGTDEDPFRVVMYSDIEPLMFLLPQSELEEATGELVDAYLLFCGLSPAFRGGVAIEKARHDQFVVRSCGNIQLQPIWEAEGGDDNTWTRKPPLFDGGFCQLNMSASLLFSGSAWFRYLNVAGEDHVVDLSWVQSTLKQLVYSAGLSSLAVYYLGLCFARDAGSIRKHAKPLLKRYPTDVCLYNGYALAEFANGNAELAIKVLASAVESQALAAPSTGYILFKTWSWIELQRGNKELATRRLCAAVDGSLRTDEGVVSPSVLTEARGEFRSRSSWSLDEGYWQAATSHIECLALLAYLTDEGGSEPASKSQGNISAAIEVFASAVDGDGLGPFANELMLQCASRMLYFHSTKGPFRRAFMREQLAGFIDKFPRNTMFISLFAWADTGVGVKDETRRLLADKVLTKTHDAVGSRLFAVSHELTRGNAQRTRAALQQAVSSEACRRSTTLWLRYVRFCRSQASLRAGASEVLYRALGSCPWSKELMMEAFSSGLGGGS